MAAAAIGLAVATVKGRGQAIDHRIYRWANQGQATPKRDAFFRGVTELGSLYASIGAAGAVAARGRRRQAADALGAALATWAAGQALKKVFKRQRPYEALDLFRLLIEKPAGRSWPSSHPAVLLTFVTVLTRNLGLARPVRASAAGLAGAVGVSRVYLGVHYPADVAGGLLLGRAIADVWSAAVSPRLVR